MKLNSRTLSDGASLPLIHALGVAGPSGPVPGANRSPHLLWSDVPPATQSFAVICVDPDVPSRGDDVNQSDRTVPYDLARVDFFHWVLVDIPADVRELAEAADADGLVPRGKAAGATALGVRGINDYTGWFAGDAAMAGNYGGYDGPWPPFNDERVHHYHFTVYALDVATLALPPLFTGAQARAAMAGHVLAQSTIVATYALNPDARV